MNKVAQKRWDIAQSSEKDFWQDFNSDELRRNHEEAYLREINVFSERWNKFIPLTKTTRVLQIGSGPLDIINYLNFGERHSIDPLADFYKKQFNFDYGSSRFVSGSGENLPYPNEYFDLVIFNNVLDHTNDPEKVLSEIKRVLKPEGIMHFECAYYQKSFLLLSKIYGFIKKNFTGEIFNIHHPYMFSLRELKNILKPYFECYNENDWERIAQDVYSSKDLKNLRKKQKLTKKLPAIFGLYGNINYSCICKKKISF